MSRKRGDSSSDEEIGNLGKERKKSPRKDGDDFDLDDVESALDHAGREDDRMQGASTNSDRLFGSMGSIDFQELAKRSDSIESLEVDLRRMSDDKLEDRSEQRRGAAGGAVTDPAKMLEPSGNVAGAGRKILQASRKQRAQPNGSNSNLSVRSFSFEDEGNSMS